MVTITRVNPAALDAKQSKQRQLSPRDLRRQALERTLARAIKGASQDGGRVAYQVILEQDEKASTVKGAFKRVKETEGKPDINLLTVGGALYVARRPQTRGRRAAAPLRERAL